MNKKVIILNGAARKNGSTAKLAEAFENGAKSAGNQVKTFYLDGMEIHSCKGCLHAGNNSKSPCSQKDDMVLSVKLKIDAPVTLKQCGQKHPANRQAHCCLCIPHIDGNSRPTMQIKTQVA